MNKALQRQLLSIAGYGAPAKRDDWQLEEAMKPNPKDPPRHQPSQTYGNMTEVRRLAGITTQFPQREVREETQPMTLLEWGIRTRGRKGAKAAEELNEALAEAQSLLDDVFDGLGPVEVTKIQYDYVAKLIANVHKRRVAEALVRWGIDAEPRYQLPSALAMINQTRKRFDLPMSSIPALVAHL
jgi:hypothetical protein